MCVGVEVTSLVFRVSRMREQKNVGISMTQQQGGTERGRYDSYKDFVQQ